MLRSHYDLFIQGQALAPHNGMYLDVQNPATGLPVTKVAVADGHDVQRAYASARQAFDSGVWSGKSARERAVILQRAATLLREAAPTLAVMETACTGRAIKEMKAQTGRIAEWYQYFGSLVEGLEGQVTPFAGSYLNYVRRVPLGVVCCFSACNHPLLLASKQLAPALAAGNCVVLKPNELTPVSAMELARILTEAGVPPGVINVVNGPGHLTGAALLELPFDKFTITGGDVVGRMVGQAAGRQLAHFTAELGGKAPALIFEDCDLEAAVRGVAFGSFIASGQTCIAATRILVQESIYDAFVQKFVEKVRSIRLGDPLDESTQLGSLISDAAVKRCEMAVKAAVEEGAKVLCGGKRWIHGSSSSGAPAGSADTASLVRGCFFEPTVLGGCKPNMRAVQEEIFGPVVSLLPFDNEARAVELANDSRYGLGAAVWTRDIKRGHRVAHQIQAGIVWINDFHRNDPSSPWGGMKDSGVGRENGWECLREYTQTQSIVVSLGEDSFDWFGQAQARYG